MAVTSTFDRFKRSHELVGHKIKPMSENKMESSLVMRVCVSTTITHHCQYNQQQQTQKQTQPTIFGAAFKSQGSQNSWVCGNVGSEVETDTFILSNVCVQRVIQGWM